LSKAKRKDSKDPKNQPNLTEMEVQVLLLPFVGTCKPLAPSEPAG